MPVKKQSKLFIKVAKILVIASFLTIIIDYLSYPILKDNDGGRYTAIIEGRSKEVSMIFSRRVLHLWTVSKIRPFVGTDAAFLIVGKVSLFVFLLFVLTILHLNAGLPLIISISLIFFPYLFIIYKNLYVQTLFFIALSSIYWFLLIKKRYLSSFFMLFLLLLTRDEAIVILFCFTLAALLNIFLHPNVKKYYFYIIACGLMAGLSWLIIAHNMQNSINMHGMPCLLFYFLRIPFLGMQNLLGFTLWVDTYKNLWFYTHQPLIVFDAPRWLSSISFIKQIGIYEWNIKHVLQTLILILSTFGTAPTILLFLFKKKSLKITFEQMSFNTIIFSGCLIFILGPFSGLPLVRYYINAWPLFFVITPLFLREILQEETTIFLKVIITYILSGWLLLALSFSLKENNLILFSLIIIEIILHLYTWNTLSLVSRKTYP